MPPQPPCRSHPDTGTLGLMASIEPYEPLHRITDELYVVTGDWGPLRRRMTIVRLECGGLLIHSPVRMNDEDMRHLDALGPVRYLVMPNLGHGSELPWYAGRYSEAKIYVPAEAGKKLSGKLSISGVLGRDWPEELREQLPCLPIDGMRWGETAFFHPRSSTLILTDLVFNFRSTDFKGLTKRLMKWNRAVDRFGPTRSFYFFFAKNRKTLRQSIGKVLEWDFDRVIMSHGHILESGGRTALAEGFSGL